MKESDTAIYRYIQNYVDLSMDLNLQKNVNACNNEINHFSFVDVIIDHLLRLERKLENI